MDELKTNPVQETESEPEAKPIFETEEVIEIPEFVEEFVSSGETEFVEEFVSAGETEFVGEIVYSNESEYVEEISQVIPRQSHTTSHSGVPKPRGKGGKERMSFRSAVALVVIGAVLGGFSLGAGFGAVTYATKAFTPDYVENSAGNIEPPDPPVEVLAFSHQINQPSISPSLDENMPGSFSELIKIVKPSVVGISSVLSGNQNFFSMPETPKGSGIIFKEDEEKVYIVTNNHVTAGAQTVNISVNGSVPVNAGIIGKDQQADLAVLYVMKEHLEKVGIQNVAVAKFGDTDTMQEGDIVLAIGNAMGEGNSTTLGIISVMSKDIRVEGKNLTVIQTDAAINPGNSGGALVNMRGEVIGINTAKTMSSPLSGMLEGLGGSAEGMGYSIGSNVVIPVVNEIMLMKPRAFLGIRGDTVSEEIASLYSIPELGVLVQEVIPNTSADTAGLKRTDIITAFKGQPIFTMIDLQTAVKESAVGEEIEINILRDGKTPMTLKVKMLPSDDTNF